MDSFATWSKEKGNNTVSVVDAIFKKTEEDGRGSMGRHVFLSTI